MAFQIPAEYVSGVREYMFVELYMRQSVMLIAQLSSANLPFYYSNHFLEYSIVGSGMQNP